MQIGVRTEQYFDYSIALTQKEYTHDIDFIEMDPNRKRMTTEPTTPKDQPEMLGSMSYKVQKTCPEFAAEVGLLQSQQASATVADFLQINKSSH